MTTSLPGISESVESLAAAFAEHLQATGRADPALLDYLTEIGAMRSGGTDRRASPNGTNA